MKKVALLIFVVFTFTGCIAPEPKEESPVHTPLPVKYEVPKTPVPTLDINETPPPPIHTTESKSSSCQECHDFYWPRLLDIPFYKQEHEDGCGQAVLQMTLAYYGVNKTQKQIAREMGKFGKTYPHDLLTYLEKQGHNAYMLELGDELWEFDPYAGKYPVIVLEHGEVVDIPLHWVLLKGRGESGYVIIDPAGQYGESNWILGENYTVIIVEGF